MQIVRAIAAVKLREVEAQQPIFEDGKNSVADVFIQRHAALERAAVGLHHARAEDRIGLAASRSGVQMRQNLRRVLPVAMQQHHDVEALFDEIAISGLLVSAVAEVLLVFEHRQLGEIAQRLDPIAIS